MSDYAPTMYELELAYIRDEKRTTNRRYRASGREPLTTEELSAEFERAIAKREREVEAHTLRAAADLAAEYWGDVIAEEIAHRMRERADGIEAAS